MLEDIRFLITQKDDRYCRTLKKKKKEISKEEAVLWHFKLWVPQGVWCATTILQKSFSLRQTPAKLIYLVTGSSRACTSSWQRGTSSAHTSAWPPPSCSLRGSQSPETLSCSHSSLGPTAVSQSHWDTKLLCITICWNFTHRGRGERKNVENAGPWNADAEPSLAIHQKRS